MQVQHTGWPRPTSPCLAACSVVLAKRKHLSLQPLSNVCGRLSMASEGSSEEQPLLVAAHPKPRGSGSCRASDDWNILSIGRSGWGVPQSVLR